MGGKRPKTCKGKDFISVKYPENTDINDQINDYTIVCTTKIKEYALQISVSSDLILIQVHLELRLDDSAPSLTSHCITKMSVDSAWPSLTYMTSPMVTDRIPEVSVLIVIIPDKIYVNIGLSMTEEEVKG